MTAAPTRRPSRPRRRRLSRFLLGAALALAGVLVPLEAPALPDSSVQAQEPPNTGEPDSGNGNPGPGTEDGEPGPVTDDGEPDTEPGADGDPVVTGTPSPCTVGQPSNSNEQVDINGPLCILKVTACPYDPVHYDPDRPGEYPRLRPSTEFNPEVRDVDERLIGIYAGFCEARHFSKDTPDTYEVCTDPEKTKGFIVRTHVMERPTDEENLPVIDEVSGNPVVHRLCRIVYPASCPVGSHDEPYGCRAVSRRAWSCPDNYFPRNEFNTCYRPLDPPSGSHPACSAPPTLVAMRCDDYAGTDYTSSPDCNSFETGGPTPELRATADAYWCEFDASRLRVACHGPPPVDGCAPEWRSCLKRASETGGCNGIAETIRCRGLQAEFDASRDKAAKAEEVRAEGCQPCVLLPFEPTPTDCPRDTYDEPTRPPQAFRASFELTHELKASYYSGSQECLAFRKDQEDASKREKCLQRLVLCADPPTGSLQWASGHTSGLAVVNSPVVLTVEGIATRVIKVAGLSDSSGLETEEARNRGYNLLAFPGDSGDVIRRWSIPAATSSLRGVNNLVLGGRGMCYYSGRDYNPLFRVVVEELWPDRREHRQEIESLFGEDSLEWWKQLSRPEKRQRTLARGLKYWPDLKTARGKANQKEYREDNLVSEVDCNWSRAASYGDQIWCRWTPTHPGYYRLTAASAWRSQHVSGITTRNSLTAHWSRRDEQRAKDPILQALKNPTTQAEIRTILNNENLKPADVGLNPELTDYLPLTAGDPRQSERESAQESPYATPAARCPSRDFRFFCGGSSASANYTVSEPIGIAVHEVRVATRTPRARSSPPPL